MVFPLPGNPMMPSLTTTECTLPWLMAPPTQAPRDLDAARHRPGALALRALGRQHRGGQGGRGGLAAPHAGGPPVRDRRRVRRRAGGLWTRAPFRLRPGEGWPLLGLGVLFAIQLGLLNVGVWLSTAGHAAVLLNAYPVYIVLLAHFLVPGDRLTAATLGGVVLGFAGILVLFGGQLAGAVGARLHDSRRRRRPVAERGAPGASPGGPQPAASAHSPGEAAPRSGRHRNPALPPPVRAGRVRADGPHLAPGRLALLPGGRDRRDSTSSRTCRCSRRTGRAALAAFSLTTPLFGVLATALVIGEPIGWRLAGSALLVAGGIAVATLLRDRATVARSRGARPAPGAIR